MKSGRPTSSLYPLPSPAAIKRAARSPSTGGEQHLENALARITCELEIIASQIAAFEDERHMHAARTNGALSPSEKLAVGQHAIKARDEIAALLSDVALLQGPALDILLDLFVNIGLGKRVSVSDASIAARVSATTGLRWIGVLIDSGLLERAEDETDGRRSFVTLTPKGRDLVERCLDALATNR